MMYLVTKQTLYFALGVVPAASYRARGVPKCSIEKFRALEPQLRVFFGETKAAKT